MDSVKIYYNNKDVFSGISPTPFVSWEQSNIEYGNRWGATTSLSLIGQITGKCNDYYDLIDKQNKLLSGFLNDFLPIKIEEDGATLYDKPYCIIRSIDFESSDYVGIVPYTINIDVYDSGYWSGYYGVLDPEDTITYSEQEDGVMTASRTISARGFNTSQSSLINAKNWVLSRTGFQSQVNPFFIQNCYGNIPCLNTFSESIDRLAGTYSVTENYILDTKRSGQGVVRYTVDISSGYDEGFNEVSIRGDVTSCKDISISGLRNIYSNLNLFNIGAKNYLMSTNLSDLNPIPLSSGVSEYPISKKLEFQVVFNNDNSPLVWVDYTTSISLSQDKGYLEVSISATINGRGPLSTRYDNVLNYYNTQFNPFVLASAAYYNSPLYNGIPLSSKKTTESVSYNQFQGTIEYSATWTTKTNNFNNLSDLNYTVTVFPSIELYIPLPSLYCNGYYTIFDVGAATRKKVEFNGNGIKFKNASATAAAQECKNLANVVMNKYALGPNLILEENSIDTSLTSNNLNFSVKWSSEGNKLNV